MLPLESPHRLFNTMQGSFKRDIYSFDFLSNSFCFNFFSDKYWGGRVVRWCWVNFQCRGVLLIRIIVGQGPITLEIGAGGVVWTFFFLLSIISLCFLPPWETARYKLKYCFKGPLNPNQPTNQPTDKYWKRNVPSGVSYFSHAKVYANSCMAFRNF